MDNTRGEKIGPRARILSVAAELFHRHGIWSVGVEVIAQAANTNKVTLYRHFASKDELIGRRVAASRESSNRGPGILDSRQPRFARLRE
jgi:AcrR family transcriptional regulator